MADSDPISLACNYVRNANHPPSIESVLSILPNNASEHQINLVKSLLPLFFGPTFAIRELVNELVGAFPMDLIMMILEYRGADTIDIFYGRHRNVGEQLKKILSQGPNPVTTHAKQKPGAFFNNPYSWLFQRKFLSFSVFYNGKLTYAAVQSDSPPNVNELWRHLCHFDFSDGQTERLATWRNFEATLSQDFPAPVVFPNPLKLRIADERPGVADIVNEVCQANGFEQIEVDILPRSNGKIFAITKDARVKLDGFPRELRKVKWKGVTYKRIWDERSRTLDELRFVIQDICKALWSQWAQALFANEHYEGLNPFQ